MDALGDLADQVQPVLITVDPERDTPERMGDYTSAFDPRILGLTGTPEQIARAAEMFKTQYRVVPNEAGDDYSVDHTSVMFLMGPDGQYVAHFDHHIHPDELARTIERRIEDGSGQRVTLNAIRGR